MTQDENWKQKGFLSKFWIIIQAKPKKLLCSTADEILCFDFIVLKVLDVMTSNDAALSI